MNFVSIAPLTTKMSAVSDSDLDTTAAAILEGKNNNQESNNSVPVSPTSVTIGTIFRKKFGDTWYDGEVIDIWNEQDGNDGSSPNVHYNVFYEEDGDMEDISHVDFMKLSILNTEEVTTDVQEQTDNTNVRTRRMILQTEYEVTETTLHRVECIPAIKDANVQTCVPEIVCFFLFCCERQRIWWRKKQRSCRKNITISSGMGDHDGDNDSPSPPLSKIQTLSKRKYCNVYRELDRGTQYFRSQVLCLLMHETTDSTVLPKVLYASIIYRLVNKVETFHKFGGIPTIDQSKKFIAFMNRLRNNNRTVFTGQHQTVSFATFKLMCQWLVQIRKGVTRIETMARSLQTSDRVEKCFTILLTIPGVGKFFAWQILCDLMESNVLPSSFVEEDYWCKLGPGAINGTETCFKRMALATSHGDDNDSTSTSTTERQQPDMNNNLQRAILLRNVQEDVYDALEIQFPKFNGMLLSLKNIEHSLCEFQKYMCQSSKLANFISRSHLDQADICSNCQTAILSNLNENIHGSSLEYQICDCCGNAYCRACLTLWNIKQSTVHTETLSDFSSNSCNIRSLMLICDPCIQVSSRDQHQSRSYSNCSDVPNELKRMNCSTTTIKTEFPEEALSSCWNTNKAITTLKQQPQRKFSNKKQKQ